jgi:hypothetical protein
MARILKEKELLERLSNLQKEYIKSFQVNESIKLSEYLHIEDIKKVLKRIRTMLRKNIERTYYHGSKIRGLQSLTPSISIHKENYVYLTTSKMVSLIYCVNAIESFYEKEGLEKPEKFHPWYSYGFRNGKLVLEECYPNALQETYENKEGIIYKCSPPQNVSNPTNIYCAYVTTEQVKVLEEIVYKNIYSTILEFEQKGLLEIRRFEELASTEKERIDQSILDSFKHFDLKSKPEYNYTVFLENKFPHLFKGE